MSDATRTWIVLAMGLLVLGAVAPEAAADEPAPEPDGPSSGATECVVVDPYAPSAGVYIDECTE